MTDAIQKLIEMKKVSGAIFLMGGGWIQLSLVIGDDTKLEL